MSPASEGVIEAALQLPELERAEVVQELLESFTPDPERTLDDLWAAELERRWADFQHDESDGVAWHDLREQKKRRRPQGERAASRHEEPAFWGQAGPGDLALDLA